MGACIVCARIKQELGARLVAHREPLPDDRAERCGRLATPFRSGTAERCPDCRTTREQMDELHLELERRKDEMDELTRRLGI